MLANVDKLTAAVYKSFGIVVLDSPLLHQAPLCANSPSKSVRTFPIHEQIEWESYDDWISPDEIFMPPKIFAQVNSVESGPLNSGLFL